VKCPKCLMQVKDDCCTVSCPDRWYHCCFSISCGYATVEDCIDHIRHMKEYDRSLNWKPYQVDGEIKELLNGAILTTAKTYFKVNNTTTVHWKVSIGDHSRAFVLRNNRTLGSYIRRAIKNIKRS
jgi:hypothetical protein